MDEGQGMNRDDIIRFGEQADEVADRKIRMRGEFHPEWHDVRDEAFAKLVAAAEREAAISKIENETCHAEINNLRLAPLFGQRHGPLAVRVDSLEAVIDAIRARGEA
jgi:hypothetical protein